jgi:GT2 family glycosyltransferase
VWDPPPDSSVSEPWTSPVLVRPAEPPTVTAIVLAYRDEELLTTAVDALLASEGVEVDVVLVDNGCTTDAVDVLASRPGVTVVRPGRNTGFADGCNLGAAHASGGLLAFINGDAVVSPQALRRLAAVAVDPGVGLASASLRLYERPDVINSAGNPVHYSGLSWAGGYGDLADRHTHAADVASATGAAVMIRRDLFDQLGGYCSLMFAYFEDTELSLRCWQRGLACRYVPEAVVLHRYEFARNPSKMYLLERNRLILLSTLFERRTLVVLTPALLGLEAAMLALATQQGWARQKLAGWWWLLRHARALMGRRRLVQATRTRSDADLAWLFTGDINPGVDTGFTPPQLVRRGSRSFWAVARWLLQRKREASVETRVTAGQRITEASDDSVPL